MYHTTTQDYQLAEYSRQYREAVLTEHKWKVGTAVVLGWLLSTFLFTFAAILSGYPAALPASGSTILVILIVAGAGSVVQFKSKSRRDSIRRDVAALGIDALQWVQQLERSLAREKVSISSNGWLIFAALFIATGVGILALTTKYFGTW